MLIESDDPLVMRDGSWTAQDTPSASGGTYLYASGSPDDVLTLEFEGPSVEIIYVKHPAFGTLAIEIDGVVVRTVITTAQETAFDARAVVNYLEAGPHILKVYAAEGTIAVDAFVAAVPFSGISTMSVVEPVEAEQGQFVHECGKQICITNSDTLTTTTLTQIADELGLFETRSGKYPIWSPDGHRIVYMLERFRNISQIDMHRWHEFWLIQMNDQGVWQAPILLSRMPIVSGTDRNMTNSTPAWSPTGDKIAFTSGAKLRYLQLTETCINDTNLDCNTTMVVQESSASYIYTNPSWSASGTKLVFSRRRNSTDSLNSLYTATLGSSQLTSLLSTANVNYLFPSFSPDGTLIAFAREQGTTRSIQVMPAAGGTSSQILTYSAALSDLGWTDTGSQLFYTYKTLGTRMVMLDGDPVNFQASLGERTRWRRRTTPRYDPIDYGVYVTGLDNEPALKTRIEREINYGLERVAGVLYAEFASALNRFRPGATSQTVYDIWPETLEVFNGIMREGESQIAFVFYDLNDSTLQSQFQQGNPSQGIPQPPADAGYSFDLRQHQRACWFYFNYSGQDPYSSTGYSFIRNTQLLTTTYIRQEPHQAVIVCDRALATHFEEATAVYYLGQIFIDRTGGTNIVNNGGISDSYYELLATDDIQDRYGDLEMGLGWRNYCAYNNNTQVGDPRHLQAVGINCDMNSQTGIDYRRTNEWARGTHGWGSYAPVVQSRPGISHNGGTFWTTQPFMGENCWNTGTPAVDAANWQQDPFIVYDWLPTSNAATIREIRAAGADMFLNWVYHTNSRPDPGGGITFYNNVFQNKLWGSGPLYTCGSQGTDDGGLGIGDARADWMGSNNKAEPSGIAVIIRSWCDPIAFDCKP